MTVNPINSQPTILLADANLDSLDRNAGLLQELGFFNHLHAENGTEAVAMVKNFRPDLLIISQDMPDISGTAILNMVREQENIQDMRSIVIVYGQQFTDLEMTKLGRIGVDSVISYPYDGDTFKKRVGEALNQTFDPKLEEAEALQTKCQAQMESGRFEEALETCNEILEVDSSAEVYYNKGYILSMRGMFEEALKSFRKATLINHQHARAFKQMGLIYHKLGREDDAERCLEHAAVVHLNLNQDNEAEEVLNTVLALRPNTTNVYNSLGIIYRRQGRFEESVRAYEKALLVHPDDENIYFNLARANIELNNPRAAGSALRQAISLNPEFAPARDLLRAIELGLKLKP
ncbi:MAG: tetratricopeptide repeat protein [Deltaproteobacteria bacterium]|jgi:tetratricopeptide (TPR) repeat protein|nr:tetratricopeptide repeat protein [Deltaproteobacteria bacterium]